MKLFKPLALGAGAFIYSVLTLHTALADDTEIYVPKDLPADQQVRPNILFVLDSSGSMTAEVDGTSPKKNRNQVLRSVVNNLIDQIKVKEDVNVGFMRYAYRDGGYVLSPVQRLTNANAASMKSIVNNINTSDYTPLLETYYEAYLYMTGQTLKYGTSSVSASRVGGGLQYKTPVEHSCQKNHIIYVTDGAPTYDTGSNTLIKDLVKDKNTLHPYTTCTNSDGKCLPHLAEYMANQDLFPSPAFPDPTNRKQTVTSHFVGFAFDLPLLQDAATAGGGSYYTSNNVSGLTDALKAIIVDITAENTGFAAPSVAVSAFNNFGYRSDLYYALFRPAEGTRWPGNVKRYKLSEDSAGNPLIVDKNGNAAIDDTTGFFSDSSSSFWSENDGKDVAKGGVAGRLLTPDTRTVLTWTAADRSPTATDGVTGSAALAALNTGNTSVTAAMLGASLIDTGAERSTFINWARGKNTNNTARLSIGDVLHNEPKLIAYTTDEDLVRVDAASKGNATSPEQLYMFFGDNEGFIHAIDPTSGDEKFAFIPKELLKNPGHYLKDAKGIANKKYGIDGQINLWTEYGPLNTSTKTRSLNKANLYAGMRRGGSNYYALDVLNINAPTLKWVIKGPEQTKLTPLVTEDYTNETNPALFTPGYAKLGRTFSAPRLTKLKVNGVETKVLVFTGGYDLDQDNVGTNVPKNDDIGNSLFVADAETGKLIWQASNSGAQLNISSMTNSMPADPTLIDINADGLLDIAYAADLRGQVFRFDFNSANTGGDGVDTGAFATGGRIASLGGATAADNRRFFNMPDVALIQERGGKTYFTVSIGAGFRESPLNIDTNDRFYVLRDSNVYSKPSSYTTIVEGDLTDASGISLTAPETATLLAEIAALESQIAGLNTALSTAQTNFDTYKTSTGFTAKQTASSQAYSDANAAQRQIDSIAAAEPYLAEHTAESSQQSQFQDSLTRARDVLEAVEQARINAQALADATLNPSDIAAAAELSTQTDQLALEYQKLKNLQSSLDTAYSAVTTQEAAIIAAKADPEFDSDTIPAMEAALLAQRATYAALSETTKRTELNTGSPTEAVTRLNAINAALGAGDAAAIAAAIAPAMTALQDSINLTGSSSATTAELLANDETSRSAALLTEANNNATTSALVASLQAQVVALTASAVEHQNAADTLAATPYDGAMPLLTAPQLSEAMAQAGPSLTAFEVYQYLIDHALANAGSLTTGIPKLRTDINTKYAQLAPGDSYTANLDQLAASKGFYLRLPKGEKVLASSLSFRGSVFFTTFSPTTGITSTCGSDTGTSRSYAMSLIDASAVYTVDVGGTDTPRRSFVNLRAGIAPTPSVILTGKKPVVIVGTEILEKDGSGRKCIAGVAACEDLPPVRKKYWREN